MSTLSRTFKQWLLGNLRFAVCLAFIGITALAVSVIFAAKPVLDVPASQPSITAVHTLTVQAEDTHLKLQSRGTLKPAQEMQLVSQVSGKVVYIAESFHTGANFKQGELLLKVDPTFAQMELEKARSQLAQAKLQQMELEANIRAKSGLNPQHNKLSPLAQGKPQLDLAQSHIRTAEMAVHFAEQQLEQTTLYAPFDGRVFMQTVQLHEQLVPGKPIGQIYTTSGYLLRIPISQQQLDFIAFPSAHSEGSKVVAHDDITGLQLEGRIVRSEGHIATNRLIYLIAQLDDIAAAQQLRLLPGSLLNITITSRRIDNTIAIPSTALHANNTVWLLNDKSRLQIRAVELLYRSPDKVYVRSGLETGDKVIISHIAALSDNMRLIDLDATDSVKQP